jgi:hypothetical protein
MMTETITAWRSGIGFGAMSKPHWWDGALDHIWPGTTDAPKPDFRFGFDDAHGHEIEVFSLPENRGYLVAFWAGDRSVSIYAADEASWLDCLTSRGSLWLGLPIGGDPARMSAQRLTEAFISRARHGEGTQIDKFTGQHRADLEEDRRARQATQARAGS